EQFIPFAKKSSDAEEGHPDPVAFRGNAVVSYLDADEQGELEDGAMLIQEASKPFDPQAFLEGHMTPVFFGSALRHFGVDELLAGLGAYAPPPKGVKAVKGGAPTEVEPGDKEVSGFIFKVQANMDPNHRDRIAFLRLTSGEFERGMKLKVQNTGRQLSVNAPIMFFASDILQRVRVKDPLKAKHLKKALEGLAEEGVTQLFRPVVGADFIVGAVGQLQFEVMADRLANEYQLDVVFEPSPYAEARWLSGERTDVEDFQNKHRSAMA